VQKLVYECKVGVFGFGLVKLEEQVRVRAQVCAGVFVRGV
jgi:hypothetical protein